MLIRNDRVRPRHPDLAVRLIRPHSTPCYDVLVSLRALFNPRTYEATRTWSVTAKRRLSPESLALGKFFFSGRDTSLGYGLTPLVAELEAHAGPDALVSHLRDMDPVDLAMLMLDTGEVTPEARATFRTVMTRGWDAAAVTTALHEASAGWARTCRRVLQDPAQAKADLLALLEEFLQAVFAEELDHVCASVAQGAGRVEELLALLPASVAIEQLTGGYTIDAGLELDEIVLAPSAFIHPYVSTRLDEPRRRAIVVFGVHSESVNRFDPAPIDADLQVAVKALGDPARLRLLRLVAAGAQTSGELQEQLGLAPATVHHHLHQLRAAGFLRQERTKAGMRYTVRQESARDLLDRLYTLVLGPDLGDTRPVSSPGRAQA